MWNLLRSRLTVVLWVECSVLQWTLCGTYCAAGWQWYCYVGWSEESVSRLEILDFKQTEMSGGTLAKTSNIQFHANSFNISRVVTFRRAERKEKRTIYHLLSYNSRPHRNSRTINVYSCRLLLTNRHSDYHIHRADLLHKYCSNCTVCNWTVLTVITQKLPLHFQLHNSTETVELMSSDMQCTRLFDIISTYTHTHI